MKKSRLLDVENIVNKIIEENSPNIKKEMFIQVGTRSTQNTKQTRPEKMMHNKTIQDHDA